MDTWRFQSLSFEIYLARKFFIGMLPDCTLALPSHSEYSLSATSRTQCVISSFMVNLLWQKKKEKVTEREKVFFNITDKNKD